MDNQKVIQQKGFNFNLNGSPEKPTKLPDGYYTMRSWQEQAFDELKDKQYVILNAPMGSGKSWFMCLLSAHKMKKNSALRCIIVVPQTIIGSGFADAKLQMPDGENVHWQIKHNLCREGASKGTINYLIKWLERPSTIFVDRTIICTHATLVAAYKKLKLENRLYLFANILLWIDEAHHIKNMEVDGLNGAVINNGIGELVAYWLSNVSNQIGLTTASFFRGDRATLLTNNMLSKFKRFDLPYDDYLRTMTHLKSFSFDFLIFGIDYIKGIELLIQQRQGKDIIYIPHPISQFSTGRKYQEVEDIIKIYGRVIHTTQDGVTIIEGARGEQKILNLVNEAQRKQKKSYFDNPILKKKPEALDVIITLGMFKEGANWIFADRSIIVGARTSLVDVIQMVGRLFRDAPGKKHVEVIQLLPFSLDQQDDNFRENLNNYLKAIYASLLLENILNPVKIKSTQKVINKEQKSGDRSDAKTNWLDLVLPDDSKQLSLLEEVSDQLVSITAQNKETINNIPLLYDKYKKIMPGILDANGIYEYKEEVAKQIWGTLVRRSMQMEGLSVEDIDFELVKKIHPLGFLLRFTSGSCDINTFENLREAISLSRIIWRSFQEAHAFVKKLELKSETEWRLYTKGLLPNLPLLPKDIPTHPDRTYKNNGWLDWGYFLGTERIANQHRKFLPFEEARDFVRSLKFKNRNEFSQWAKSKDKPLNIPTTPANVYENDGWCGWGDFLGTEKIANQHRKFLSFEKARNFVRSLKFKNRNEFLKWTQSKNRALNIPTHPAKIYKNNGWLGWGDFLGTDNISLRNKKYNWRPFEEARRYVRQFKFKNRAEWNKWVQSSVKPDDIPAKPWQVYAKDGWLSLGDFLGTV